MTDKDYSYNRFGSKAVRVGQAVLDLYDDHPNTVEEVLDDMGLGEGCRQTILDEFTRSRGHYPDKYFILSIFNKALVEMGIDKVYKTSVRSFVLPLDKTNVMNSHPHCVKTLYSVDALTEDIRPIWSIPGWEECKSILKYPKLYDPELVASVKEVAASYGIGATG